MVSALESGPNTELHHLPAGHEKRQELGTEETHCPECKPEEWLAFLTDTTAERIGTFAFHNMLWFLLVIKLFEEQDYQTHYQGSKQAEI